MEVDWGPDWGYGLGAVILILGFVFVFVKMFG